MKLAYGKKIWSLDCPNKVKHFIWKAYKNSLPTKCNLGSSENVVHALWGNGQVLASLAQQLNQAYKAIEIDAMATIRALEFAIKLGLDRVVVEGDSSIITIDLRTKESGLTSYGLLISDLCVFESFFS